MPRNIVFDFGGVILDWNPRYFYDTYFGDPEKSEWFLTHICPYEWNVEMDGGKPVEQGIRERIALFPEWEKEIRLYFADWTRMVPREIPGMNAVVRDLKARGYHTYGLTNWSAETFRTIRHLFPTLALMEGIVVSGEEKLLKPDPRIFHLLRDRYGLDFSESLFIDDNPDNVRGSEAAGLPAVRFESAEQIRALLLG